MGRGERGWGRAEEKWVDKRLWWGETGGGECGRPGEGLASGRGKGGSKMSLTLSGCKSQCVSGPAERGSKPRRRGIKSEVVGLCVRVMAFGLLQEAEGVITKMAMMESTLEAVAMLLLGMMIPYRCQ